MGGDVELDGQRDTGAQGATPAIGAGAGIGVAGVDQQGADVIGARQMLAAKLDRRCAKAVLREDAGDRRAWVEQHHGEVLAVGLAHTRFGDAQAHAGNRKQVSRIGGA